MGFLSFFLLFYRYVSGFPGLKKRTAPASGAVWLLLTQVFRVLCKFFFRGTRKCVPETVIVPDQACASMKFRLR